MNGLLEVLLWIGIILFIFFGFWEALALLTGQKIIPSWSRLVRTIWRKNPKLKSTIFVITLILGFSVTIWLAFHFITGW